MTRLPPVLSLNMPDDFALRMMKKLGWQEGKGLGKEENGRVKPVQVEQKQNVKGIGYGTEGAFAPWWDDLYTKTAVGTQIKTKEAKKLKEKKKSKKEKEDKHKSDKKIKKSKKEKKEKTKAKEKKNKKSKEEKKQKR